MFDRWFAGLKTKTNPFLPTMETRARSSLAGLPSLETSAREGLGVPRRTYTCMALGSLGSASPIIVLVLPAYSRQTARRALQN